MPLKALALNCTLKADAAEKSSTGAMTAVLEKAFADHREMNRASPPASESRSVCSSNAFSLASWTRMTPSLSPRPCTSSMKRRPDHRNPPACVHA